MKIAFTFVLFILTSSLWGQSLTLPPEDLIKIENFVKNYLGLSTKQTRLLIKIQVTASEVLLENFAGHAKRGSLEIQIQSSLFNQDNKSKLMGTIVHEIIHVYYHKYKPYEKNFFLEGVALLGEYLFLQQQFGKRTAFASFLPIVDQALKAPIQQFFTFQITAADYGTAFLFFLFCYENFGESTFIIEHFASKQDSINGISDSVKSSDVPLSWKEIGVIQESFYKSLEEKRNILALRMNNRFDQFFPILPK